MLVPPLGGLEVARVHLQDGLEVVSGARRAYLRVSRGLLDRPEGRNHA